MRAPVAARLAPSRGAEAEGEVLLAEIAEAVADHRQHH
jgi:hypothetical protein